jgi:hypothetical protein
MCGRLRVGKDFLNKGLAHGDKIQAHQGKTIAEMELRIAKLEREKHAKIGAGIAKKIKNWSKVGIVGIS